MMKTKTRIDLHKILTEVFIVLLMFSIVYSKFLLSISMITLLVLTIWEFRSAPSFHIKVRKDLRANLRLYLKAKPYLAISLLFIMLVFSGINSADFGEWWHHLRLKVPYLILPFVFYSFDRFHQSRYYRYAYYFVLLISVSLIGVVFNYYFNIEAMEEVIKVGQSIPTPIDHIKFSLMVAFSAILGIVLYWNQFHFKYEWESKLLLALSLISFIFLHVLAVRSGLACAYAAIIYLVITKVWGINKKYSIGAIIVLLFLPFLAYKYVPSLNNKVNYMLYDFEMYKNGTGDNYSDAGRIYSYFVAKDIFQKEPIIGCGIGDLRQSCIESYQSLYPEKNLPFKYPHNQYLFILAGTGIIGLLIFLIGMLFPLFYQKNYKDHILTSFIIILMISFLVENTIERSYSLVYHLFFVLVALNYANYKRSLPSDN